MIRRSTLVVLVALLGAMVMGSLPARAVEPSEMLKNPALESRARVISKELRCLVCQNENIDESDASLARDLRLLVRDRLKKGESNKQVLDYIVSRYGDYVLLKPPFKISTLFLWLGPVIFLLLAGFGAWIFFRRPHGSAVAGAEGMTLEEGVVPPPLTAEEKARLHRLMNDEEPR